MIQNFKDYETEKIYNQEYSKRFPWDIQNRALRKLIMLDNSRDLNDLRVPPGNHLEELKGDRLGQYSIRVNEKYRICFEYLDGDYYNVEIVDYHKG